MTNRDPEPTKHDVTGLKVKVTFDLPFSLNLPDGIYSVARQGHADSVQIEQIAQDHIDPRLGLAKADTEYIRDRYGRLRFSRLIVELPSKVVISQETRRQVEMGHLEALDDIVQLTINTDELISSYGRAAFMEAVDAGNRLIEVYRHVTGHFHIRRVPADEIYQAEIQWFQSDELLGGTHYVSFGQGMTLQPTGLDEEMLNEFRSWLSTTKGIPVFFDLFRDANDRLDRSEYRMAVIDARTALEVFVDEVLLGYFHSQKTTIECACRILGVQPRDDETLETALDSGRINRKLGHALKVALGLDLHDGNPDLWQRWLKAKKLREKGAHQGRESGREEAIEAVNTVGEIIDNIRQGLKASDWLEREVEADGEK